MRILPNNHLLYIWKIKNSYVTEIINSGIEVGTAKSEEKTDSPDTASYNSAIALACKLKLMIKNNLQ